MDNAPTAVRLDQASEQASTAALPHEQPQQDTFHPSWTVPASKYDNQGKASTAWGSRDGRNGVLGRLELEEDEKIFACHDGTTGINFDKYDEVQAKVTEPVPPLQNFHDIKINEAIVDNIRRLGYVKPTPV